jgi:hypothetical protein
VEILDELLANALEELGPDVTDQEVAEKLLDYMGELPDVFKADIVESLIRRTTTTQLSHLREVAEAATGRDIPGQITEKPEADG